ncbi:hypothetical protein ABID22_000337 [Pontibacter aydingkolensis]|uniref:Uncharacterized protein n=1 Tax=Pontibacter aydingkolensis TaxID=1911536 RepID=A0ABS7CQE0_9BACT|nr:hypothetical protein [Pontibacter aydingkolensis]MBW7465998.1 hypothetical protein [Pontibacter aydingkolensis]
MSFQEENAVFINKVIVQLAYVSGRKNKKRLFDQKIKDEALKLINISYRRRVKEPKQVIHFYEDVLNSEIGVYVKEHLCEYIVDVYLEANCDRILEEIKMNSELCKLAASSSIIPDLILEVNGNDYLYRKLKEVGVPQEARFPYSIAYSLADTICRIINQVRPTVELETVLTHFIKYYNSLDRENKRICANTFLKTFNNYLSDLLSCQIQQSKSVGITEKFQKLKKFLGLVRDFKSKRILDYSSIPLLDFDAKEHITLGDKYLEQHRVFSSLLKKIEEHVKSLDIPLHEDEVLELLLEIAVLEKTLTNIMDNRLLKSMVSVSKFKIIETLGVDFLKDQYTRNYLFKEVIRSKYIFEALQD